MPKQDEALPGRAEAMPLPARHAVNGAPLRPPYPAGTEVAEFGMGCFWGAEKLFWQMPGVVSTSVGYAGGFTPNPTYAEVCTGRTGHIEVVRVVFDPTVVSYGALLKAFWEEHDPTQGMRQGGDSGTQYRSAILTHGDAQQREAEESRAAFQLRLTAAGRGRITAELSGPQATAEAVLAALRKISRMDWNQLYRDEGRPGWDMDGPTPLLPELLESGIPAVCTAW